MSILRSFGLILMALALALVAASGIYYLLPTAVDTRRVVYAPGGGTTNGPLDHGGLKTFVIANVLLFLAGLAAFLVSWTGQNQRPVNQMTRMQKKGKSRPDSMRDTASAAKDLYARYRKRPPF
jgi:hypothetical protein